MTAPSNASKLLTKANISAETDKIYRERDADIIAQMEDWKLHAPRAQRRFFALAVGLLPQGTINEQSAVD